MGPRDNSDAPPPAKDGERRLLYGRRKGHPLSARQQRLVGTAAADWSIPTDATALDPATLFDRVPDRIILEIGFGSGEHLAANAQAHPRWGFLGSEPFLNGFAAMAAVIAEPERYVGKKVGVVICGGNIDMRLLSGVLIRGLVRDGRLVRLRITIVDQPGQLARLSQVIGGTGANIIEVDHQRLFADVPAKRADIDVTLESRDAEHVEEIVAALDQAGFPARVLASRSADPRN